MPNGQYPLDPSTPLVTVRSITSLPPDHAEAKHPFRIIVGGIHTVFRKENKQVQCAGGCNMALDFQICGIRKCIVRGAHHGLR